MPFRDLSVSSVLAEVSEGSTSACTPKSLILREIKWQYCPPKSKMMILFCVFIFNGPTENRSRVTKYFSSLCSKNTKYSRPRLGLQFFRFAQKLALRPVAFDSRLGSHKIKSVTASLSPPYFMDPPRIELGPSPCHGDVLPLNYGPLWG